MGNDDHVRWLYRELAKHTQPCRCTDCASALGELLFRGEQPDWWTPDTTQQAARRAA